MGRSYLFHLQAGFFPTKKVLSKVPKHWGMTMVTPTLNRLEFGEEQLGVISRIICQFTAIISLHGEMSKEATEYPIIPGQDRNIQELSAITKLLFGCNLAKKKRH